MEVRVAQSQLNGPLLKPDCLSSSFHMLQIIPKTGSIVCASFVRVIFDINMKIHSGVTQPLPHMLQIHVQIVYVSAPFVAGNTFVGVAFLF